MDYSSAIQNWYSWTANVYRTSLPTLRGLACLPYFLHRPIQIPIRILLSYRHQPLTYIPHWPRTQTPCVVVYSLCHRWCLDISLCLLKNQLRLTTSIVCFLFNRRRPSTPRKNKANPLPVRLRQTMGYGMGEGEWRESPCQLYMHTAQ